MTYKDDEVEGEYEIFDDLHRRTRFHVVTLSVCQSVVLTI